MVMMVIFKLVANIYSWSYPPYDSSGNIILNDG